jgi:hypothetical protein
MVELSWSKHYMADKYSDIERQALRDKLNSPDKEIICPRCGAVLIFRQIGNSCEVKCPTQGCLYGGIRGF